jgi:hypothetical protein
MSVQPFRRTESFFLSAVLAGRLSLALWLWYRIGLPFLPLSFDDFSRTLIAYRWGLWVREWLPLPFLVVGGVTRLFPSHWVLAPLLVNLFSSSLAMVFLYLFARSLFNSPLIASFTLLIAASLPWPLWLSISGLPGSLFQCFMIGGFLGLLCWLRRDRLVYLLGASTMFALATMTRYESWGFAVCFALVVIARLALTSRLRWRSLLATSPPLIFPVFWGAMNALTYGDPLHFMNFVESRYSQAPQGTDLVWWKNLTYYVELLPQISPLVFFLVLIGLGFFIVAAHSQQSVVLPLLALWGGGLASLIVSSLLGAKPTHLPVRVVIVPFLLLTPLAAYAPGWLAQQRPFWPKVTAFLVLAVVLGVNLSHWDEHPFALSQELKTIGEELNQFWMEGFLGPDDRVLVERRGWDYLAFQVLSEHPDQVWVDSGAPAGLRWQMAPVVLSQETPGLEALLRGMRVRLVLAHSPSATAQVQSIMTSVWQTDTYCFYIYPNDQDAYRATKTEGR